MLLEHLRARGFPFHCLLPSVLPSGRMRENGWFCSLDGCTHGELVYTSKHSGNALAGSPSACATSKSYLYWGWVKGSAWRPKAMLSWLRWGNLRQMNWSRWNRIQYNIRNEPLVSRKCKIKLKGWFRNISIISVMHPLKKLMKEKRMDFMKSQVRNLITFWSTIYWWL